jgi:hypothetical protein
MRLHAPEFILFLDVGPQGRCEVLPKCIAHDKNLVTYFQPC